MRLYICASSFGSFQTDDKNSDTHIDSLAGTNYQHKS